MELKKKPKKICSFSLSRESIEKLEKISKALGMSQSKLVEQMINKLHFTEEVQHNINEISRLQKKTRVEILKEMKLDYS